MAAVDDLDGRARQPRHLGVVIRKVGVIGIQDQRAVIYDDIPRELQYPPLDDF